jgi:asparagine synthase (glutamine-hydrolysing)
MFAFAVWDRQARQLTIARDRLGEKPLYYGHAGGTFIFGSELKALTSHPKFRRDVDREALTLFLRYSYVPTPRSIWKGVYKLPPAHFLVIDEKGVPQGKPTPYWDYRAIAEKATSQPLVDTPELVDRLESLLKDAVARRMEADVPLGAFLSGGIDSSLIVSLMQAQSSRPVKTFTIGFGDEAYDEAPYAHRVAAHLKTDHTEWRIEASDILDVIPRLPTMYDEPFADSSQIPTHLVSALTRRHVTVSLSGDGGDELFGGYNRYVTGLKTFRMGRRLGPARDLAAGFLKSRAGIATLTTAMKFAPANRRHLNLVDRLPKVGYALQAKSPQALYRRLVSLMTDPAQLIIGGSEPSDAGIPAVTLDDIRHEMMYLDTITYLPDDILAKVDRASMAVGLEARVPFLDHRVVELAWQLPLSAKFRDGKGKHILREILYRYVPRTLIERPKVGFGVPISRWLNAEMRDWAEDMLDERTLRSDGFFDATRVRQLWNAQLHTGGLHFQIWNILMAQAWLREHAVSPRVAPAPQERLSA